MRDLHMCSLLNSQGGWEESERWQILDVLSKGKNNEQKSPPPHPRQLLKRRKHGSLHRVCYHQLGMAGKWCPAACAHVQRSSNTGTSGADCMSLQEVNTSPSRLRLMNKQHVPCTEACAYMAKGTCDNPRTATDEEDAD